MKMVRSTIRFIIVIESFVVISMVTKLNQS